MLLSTGLLLSHTRQFSMRMTTSNFSSSHLFLFSSWLSTLFSGLEIMREFWNNFRKSFSRGSFHSSFLDLSYFWQCSKDYISSVIKYFQFWAKLDSTFNGYHMITLLIRKMWQMELQIGSGLQIYTCWSHLSSIGRLVLILTAYLTSCILWSIPWLCLSYSSLSSMTSVMIWPCNHGFIISLHTKIKLRFSLLVSWEWYGCRYTFL